MRTKDQVYALSDGYYCMVDGQEFGPWPLIEYARAGLQTERRRAEKRRTLTATERG